MTSAPRCSRRADCPVLTDRAVDDLARSGAVVLDSWHLYDGAAVAVDRHRARFTAGVAEVFAVSEEEVGASYDHALKHLPVKGSWFPAFVWTSAGLLLAVRRFPVEQLKCTSALGGPTLDRRNRPDIKGFDYLWQADRRREAVASGYDDMLLATASGGVSETVFGTLVLVDGDDLIVPEAPRLPGVTLSVIVEHAARHGLTVRETPVTVEEVAGAATVLTLSALHGVRLVDRLGDQPLDGDRRLRDALQHSLETARRSLPGGW